MVQLLLLLIADSIVPDDLLADARELLLGSLRVLLDVESGSSVQKKQHLRVGLLAHLRLFQPIGLGFLEYRPKFPLPSLLALALLSFVLRWSLLLWKLFFHL